MDLNQLFKIQEVIENKIKSSTNIPEDLLGKENVFDLKFLAFQVKLGQLANTTKCYKYHKAIESIPREKLILRYMDALQFLISIGNEYDFNIINKEVLDSVEKPNSIIKGFSEIFTTIIKLKESILSDNYIDALSIYIHLFVSYVYLGEEMGLTFEEVYNYYTNHYTSK